MTDERSGAPFTPSSTGPGMRVGAVVLAAGTSSRMGQSKAVMDWGGKAMVRHVVEVLAAGGVDGRSVAVVVGHRREMVEAALQGSAATPVYNAGYADGSLLRSLQVGLRALLAFDAIPTAGLVALGDQPQIGADIVRAVILRWRSGGPAIVAPTCRGRRGHPILFDRSIWAAVLAAPPVGSPRDLLGAFEEHTAYVETDDDSVLRDIDTPQDYRRELERRV